MAEIYEEVIAFDVDDTDGGIGSHTGHMGQHGGGGGGHGDGTTVGACRESLSLLSPDHLALTQQCFALLHQVYSLSVLLVVVVLLLLLMLLRCLLSPLTLTLTPRHHAIR